MTRLMPSMLLALALVGCGQTGPLYMPGDEQARERYDPQGAYESSDSDASASDQASDDTRTNGSKVSVPDAEDSPTTPTPGATGVSATTTGAPAAAPAGGGS